MTHLKITGVQANKLDWSIHKLCEEYGYESSGDYNESTGTYSFGICTQDENMPDVNVGKDGKVYFSVTYKKHSSASIADLTSIIENLKKAKAFGTDLELAIDGY